MATVSGRVFDPDTGLGVEGVPVKFDAYVAVSDDGGRYSLTIPAGTYTLAIRTEFRRPLTERVEIRDPATTLDIPLQKAVPI